MSIERDNDGTCGAGWRGWISWVTGRSRPSLLDVQSVAFLLGKEVTDIEVKSDCLIEIQLQLNDELKGCGGAEYSAWDEVNLRIA